MFKKLLLKILKKTKLTPEEKAYIQEYLNEVEESVQTDKGEEVKGDNENMANEEMNKKETPAEEPKEVKQIEAQEEKTAPSESEPNTEQGQISQTPDSGNAVRVEDLVTREELDSRMSAFTAKYEAVVNENEGLKDKIKCLQDKYENKDFGAMSPKGMQGEQRAKDQTFDDYSKNFIQK